MDTHPAIHPTSEILQAYGLGKLDDASAEAVNKHLEDCADCRRKAAEMSPDSFLGRLRDAQGGPEVPSSVTTAPEPCAGSSDVGDAATIGLSPHHPIPEPETRIDDDPTLDPPTSGDSPMVSDDTRDFGQGNSTGADLQPGTFVGYFGDYELK